MLVTAGFFSEQSGRKAHFAFTFLLLGSNPTLAPLATSLLHFTFNEHSAASFGIVLLMLTLCGGLFWYARRTQSYWFLVLVAGYAYLTVGCLLAQLIMALPNALTEWAITILFTLSALSVVLFFVNLKKIVRGPASVPPVDPLSN